jgi:hypothetical protein
MSRAVGPRFTEAELEHYNALARLLRSRASVGRLLGVSPSGLDAAICRRNARALERLRAGLARAWPAPGGDA